MDSTAQPIIELQPTAHHKRTADWLRLFLRPGQVTELRAPKVKRKFGRPVTVSGFYDFDHIDQLATDAVRLSKHGLDGTPAPGVYFVFNVANPALLARKANGYDVAETGSTTNDQDIIARRWLLIDVDPVRPADISATDQEKQEAEKVAAAVRDHLTAGGWPLPIKSDSGNGWHLYYRIDLPADDGGLIKAVLNALADRFDNDAAKVDTSVFNASRISKIPGTKSRKGDEIDGRPHRWSMVADVPDPITTVSTDQLEAVAAEWRAKEAARVNNNRPAVSSSDGRERTGGKSIADRARAYLAKMPGGISGQGGHDATFAAAAVLVKGFSLPIDDAYSLLAEWNSKCDPPWTEGELRHKLEDAAKAPGEAGYLIKDDPKPAGKRRAKTSAAVAHSDAGSSDLWTSIVEPQGQTDIANARRFLKAHRENVRFCFPWGKWLAWDGMRWAVDEGGAAVRLAMSVADGVWTEAASFRDNPDVRKFAISTSGHARINAMLKLAAPEVEVMVADMDTNPDLLTCPNGTVDLRTGELRPHRREDNCTKLCPTNFIPDAPSYHWDRFLEGIFDGDSPTIEFLQRLAGYALTGHTSEQILAVFYGGGSNGKSTLLGALQETWGSDFACSPEDSLLVEKKNQSHPTGLTDLFGKRLAVSQETDSGARMAESIVKRLTGGDSIRARKCYEDNWEFKPTHKLVLSTNHKPRIKGTDHSIWRRMALVPFTVKYWNPELGESGPPELMIDKSIPGKLAQEREGILAWAVRGCLDWRRSGLRAPVSVQHATAEYRSEEDVIGRFVDEMCLKGQAYKVRFSTLYTKFEEWSNEFGENRPSRKAVGKWLQAANLKPAPGGERWYCGLDLKPTF